MADFPAARTGMRVNTRVLRRAAGLGVAVSTSPSCAWMRAGSTQLFEMSAQNAAAKVAPATLSASYERDFLQGLEIWTACVCCEIAAVV